MLLGILGKSRKGKDEREMINNHVGQTEEFGCVCVFMRTFALQYPCSRSTAAKKHQWMRSGDTCKTFVGLAK